MDEIIDIATLFGPMPLASADLTVDSLLALMQKHSVRAACTLSTLGLLLDPAIGNAATRAACLEHSELLPVATLNPLLFYGDTTSLARLKEDGFRLIRFFPAQQGWPVDFAPFREIIAVLAEMRLPLMMDITRSGDITALQNMLVDYPAPVVLTGVGADSLAEALCALRVQARWHIETSHLLGMGCLKVIADALGPERVLFGSGAPMQPIAGLLQMVQYAGLSTEAQQAVLGGNARRILSLA
jgi:predicted TIM-barrel fold metal-dependent hydrolase